MKARSEMSMMAKTAQRKSDAPLLSPICAVLWFVSIDWLGEQCRTRVLVDVDYEGSRLLTLAATEVDSTSAATAVNVMAEGGDMTGELFW